MERTKKGYDMSLPALEMLLQMTNYQGLLLLAWELDVETVILHVPEDQTRTINQ